MKSFSYSRSALASSSGTVSFAQRHHWHRQEDGKEKEEKEDDTGYTNNQ